MVMALETVRTGEFRALGAVFVPGEPLPVAVIVDVVPCAGRMTVAMPRMPLTRSPPVDMATLGFELAVVVPRLVTAVIELDTALVARDVALDLRSAVGPRLAHGSRLVGL